MAWTICFLVSLLLAAAAVRIVFDKNLGRTRIIYALLCCLLISYLLYIPAFWDQYEPTAALFGCLINTMQVISMDADYLAFYDLILEALEIKWFSNLYFTFLAALHFLLPVVSAMTAVTVIMRCLTQLQVGMMKKHRRTLYVFSQINEKSILLARDIYTHNKASDILFLHDPDEADYTDLQQELHCSIINEEMETVHPDMRRRTVQKYTD